MDSSNLIGPIPIDSWYYIRMLRESIKDHEGNTLNSPKFDMLKKAHNELYKKEVRNWV